jgi:hypothetical protein
MRVEGGNARVVLGWKDRGGKMVGGWRKNIFKNK